MAIEMYAVTPTGGTGIAGYNTMALTKRNFKTFVAAMTTLDDGKDDGGDADADVNDIVSVRRLLYSSSHKKKKRAYVTIIFYPCVRVRAFGWFETCFV
jgi:hypothetical protein